MNKELQLKNACILLDLEGMVISNNENKVLAVPTEISYLIFKKRDIIECYSTLLKYNLYKYNKSFWYKSYKYIKKNFKGAFQFNESSQLGKDPNVIKQYLINIIKKYDMTIYAKGLNFELQYLFGDLDEFHSTIRPKDIFCKYVELNDLKMPKYDNIENKNILIKEFYNKHKSIIETNLKISKEELFELNLNYYISFHYSILEIIVFYKLLPDYEYSDK
jgi:hypothetical protein